MYSRVIPRASRRRSDRARLSVYDSMSWNAIAAATRPDTTTPTKKSAGIWKRRERNTPASTVLPAGSGLARRRDLVADAPDGDDRRRVAELAAKLAHVHVHGARVARKGVS